jgi:glycosyltransferase involved in cell wall biosynthesis
VSLPRTLFVGLGASGPCWYRAALPATALGADWVGVRGTPPELRFVTGDTGRVRAVEDLFGYDVLVVQQPHGREWVALIRELQARGVRVLYEIDDLLDAVRKAAGHEHAKAFGRDRAKAAELAMRVCDGVICSTDFLARRYASVNPEVSVCRNGLDLRRYELTRVPREDVVTIGWAGGAGHESAVQPWLPAVREILRARPHTRFMSVGAPYAELLEDEFGPDRAIAVPFGQIETYPAAMVNFDVALAPAAPSNFFRAKSDLRWLEASALAIPVVADPGVYPDIEHGVTGLHAPSAAEAAEHLLALVDSRELRETIGAAARDVVSRTRRIEVAAEQWRAVLEAAVGAEVAA